ncbi:MAG: hypothetical protein A4E35_01563 [Methanoregula sp. PtaU1.Bin051]|nr:MAG: hypothetical protein A4E35_01563 [Methanoregula sp. PtaU1.Bin051]
METESVGNFFTNPLKYTVLILLSLVAIFLTLYCLTQDIQVVFTHFFYVPVIIAAYWFKKKGILYAVLISGFYLACVYLLAPSDTPALLAAASRAIVFIGIAIVIALFSEMLARHQQELAVSEEKFRGIWEHIQAGIVLVDWDTHRILAANPEAERLTGYTEKEMVGHVCHRFICPALEGKCPISDLGMHMDHAERALLNKNGASVPILKTVTVMTVERKKYLVENFVDISALKDAENALIAYIREATLRIRNPVELVRDNLDDIREQVVAGQVAKEHIATAIAVQAKNMDGIVSNLGELEKAIAEKRREIPDALRDYLKR